MRFRNTTQVVNSNILSIISREIRKQKLHVPRASKNLLAQIRTVSDRIEHQGLPDNFVRLKLPHRLGYGIFLALNAQPIPRNTLIAPYTGEVFVVPEYTTEDSGYVFSLISNLLLSKRDQTSLDSKRKYHPRRLYAITLDALKKGNFTRFINHSEKPNVYAEAFSIPKNNPYGLPPSPMQILYFAKKTINPGEQLLVCYEEEEGSYWGALKIKPFPMDPTTFQL